MAPPRKFIPRIIGEDATSYLLTATNHETHRERSPKWISKEVAQDELIVEWNALARKVATRIDQVRHLPAYQGPDRVVAHINGSIMAVILDNQVGDTMKRVLGERDLSGNVWYLAPFDDRSNSNDLVELPIRQVNSHNTDAINITTPAILETTPISTNQDPFSIDRPEVFHCTSFYHEDHQSLHNTSMDAATFTNLSDEQQEILMHGASLPICYDCAKDHLYQDSPKCACLVEKCSQCLLKTLDDMEVQFEAMAYATEGGSLCLKCAEPVGEFKEMVQCTACSGVNIEPIR